MLAVGYADRQHPKFFFHLGEANWRESNRESHKANGICENRVPTRAKVQPEDAAEIRYN